MPSDAARLIVLAGGVGKRLGRVTRTLTGTDTPKQFCRFGGGRSLLQETIRRTLPIIPLERVSVVVTGDQARLAYGQLGPAGASLVVQPMDRGTAIGLLLPLLELYARDPDATVVVTPADHAFAEPSELIAVLRSACARARDSREIMLVGALPDAPRDDFGWIVRAGRGDGGFAPVERFEEKPEASRARELMDAGALFNTLILVARAGSLLGLYRDHAPGGVDALSEALAAPAFERAAHLSAAFASLPASDLSRDILARARNLSVCALSARAGWTDLGDEARLVRWLADRGHHREVERIARGMSPAL